MSKKKNCSESKNYTRPPRAVCWSCIIYEDSCPDWRERLALSFIPCEVSPLHDKDIREEYELLTDEELQSIPEDMRFKKPHYHALFHFTAPISQNGIIRRLTNVAANNVFEMVSSETAYDRYLCHEDNPEKAQYNRDDVILFNGYVPPLPEVEITAYDVYLLCAEACCNSTRHLNTVGLIDYVRTTKDEAFTASFVKFFFSHAYAVKTVLADFS